MLTPLDAMAMTLQEYEEAKGSVALALMRGQLTEEKLKEAADLLDQTRERIEHLDRMCGALLGSAWWCPSDDVTVIEFWYDPQEYVDRNEVLAELALCGFQTEGNIDFKEKISCEAIDVTQGDRNGMTVTVARLTTHTFDV